MCTHQPPCPPIDGPGGDTAAVLIHHGEWGWSMLCNGGIVLDAAVRPAVSLADRRARRPARADLPSAA